MEELDQNLACGEFVGQLKIESVLGMGGFGVTYKAIDPDLEKYFAVKEYLPSDLIVRNADSKSLQPKTGRSADFKYGLERFLDEAKTLAKFNHTNICQVTQFVQANNTAYLVMNYEPGEALDDYLKRINFHGQMPELEILSIIKPILNGLEAVHKEGLLHRDIKPGNIYLRQNGEPMLIDFGAARYALGAQSKSISAIVSMGYAPPEQYTSRGKQGEWTDLYAVGAVIYCLITGKAPIESPDRREALANDETDPLVAAVEVGEGRYSENLLKAADWCLNLSYKQRPQTAGALLQCLSGQGAATFTSASGSNESVSAAAQPKRGGATRRVDAAERFSSAEPKDINSKPKSKQTKILGTIILTALVLIGLGGGLYYWSAEQQAQSEIEAWQDAQVDGSLKAYQAYVRRWPLGQFVPQARLGIKQKKYAAKQQTEKIVQLQELFSQLGLSVVKSGRWDSQMAAMVTKFQQQQKIKPDPRLSPALLTSLVQLAKAKLALQQNQRLEQQDALAFSAAQAAGTVEAYQKYLNKHPQGKFQSIISGLLKQRQQAIKTAKAVKAREALRAKLDQARQPAATLASTKRRNPSLDLSSTPASKQSNRPKPIVAIEPRYPVMAARNGVEGHVVVGFTINTIGGVKDAVIISAEPKRVFDRQSLRAIRKFKYRPSIKNGKPVEVSDMQFRFDFKLGQ